MTLTCRKMQRVDLIIIMVLFPGTYPWTTFGRNSSAYFTFSVPTVLPPPPLPIFHPHPLTSQGLWVSLRRNLKILGKLVVPAFAVEKVDRVVLCYTTGSFVTVQVTTVTQQKRSICPYLGFRAISGMPTLDFRLRWIKLKYQLAQH